MPSVPDRLRLVLLVSSTLVSSGLGAQGLAVPVASTPTGVVVGRVTRARDSIPLANALVTIDGTELSARTGADGTFRIDRVPAGNRSVRAARIGYHPTVVSEVATVGGTTTADIGLHELPGWLTAVEIRGEKRDVPPSLTEVYRRGASGFGSFFTREDIEREKAYDVKSILSSVPGVYWNDKGVTFARCRPSERGPVPKEAIASNSPQAIVAANSDKIQVYVDGAKVTQDPVPGGIQDDEFSVAGALRHVNIKNVQAIEVYRGVAEIPAEFLSDACAVIAIWTRRY